MKNDASSNTTTLKQTDVVYRFRCSTGDCATREVYYIGHTTTSLSRRLTMHLQDGGPKQHTWDQHKTQLTRDTLTANTTIIWRCHDKRRLMTAETIHIRDTAPIINAQTKTLTHLPLFDKQLHSNATNTVPAQPSHHTTARPKTQHATAQHTTQHPHLRDSWTTQHKRPHLPTVCGFAAVRDTTLHLRSTTQRKTTQQTT